MKVVTKKAKVKKFFKENWKKLVAGGVVLTGAGVLYFVTKNNKATEDMIESICSLDLENDVVGFTGASLNDVREVFEAVDSTISPDRVWDEIIFVGKAKEF